MDATWCKIKKKCDYAFRDVDKKTDQDDLLDFMRSFIQSRSGLRIETSSSVVIDGADNVNDSKWSTTDQSDVESLQETDNQANGTTKHLTDFSQLDTSKSLAGDKVPSNENDGGRGAIRSSFMKLPKSERCDAMVRLCNKIMEFKKSREACKNNR